MGFWRVEWRLHWHYFLHSYDDAAFIGRRHLFTGAAIRRRHSLPSGGYPAAVRRRRPDSGWHTPGLPHFRRSPLWDSRFRSRLFAQRHCRSAGIFELPDGMAHGTAAAFGFYVELAGWPHQGQRGHRAGGRQRRRQRVRHGHDECDPRHRWLLRPGLWFHVGLLYPAAVPRGRHAPDTFPPGLGSPYLTGGQERPFPILNATACNIPSSAAAYSLNFTVVPHGPLGYLTVWSTGGSRPNVSTLNDIPGQNIANAAIVVAGASGEVSVYPTNDTDLVIDINGYFAPAVPGGGLSLYGVRPCRVIDTRKVGGGQPFSGTLTPPVDVVDTGCGTSSLAQAYVFNATVVPQGALGYLTLWPDGIGRPGVSTLNALDGSISSNMAVVPTTNGKVDAYASGLTQLVLDISSYFAP